MPTGLMTATASALIEEQGAVPNIPPKSNRRWKSCFSKTLYKGRNAIERMFCRVKDCRRLATRYDKLAANFLGNIPLAAAIMWWLGVLVLMSVHSSPDFHPSQKISMGQTV